MIQVAKSQSATIYVTFHVGEVPTNVTTPTVEITADGGGVVQTPVASTPGSSDGVYTYTLTPAQTATCGILNVTWTGVISTQVQTITTQVEIVGDFYFTLAELRAMPDIGSNTTRYGTKKLEEARTWITSIIDRVCRTSFVERYHREVINAATLDTYETDYLEVRDSFPISALSLKYDNVTASVSALSPLFGLGLFTTNDGTPVFNANWFVRDFRYTAGHTTKVPDDLKTAALIGARDWLLRVPGASGIPDRAIGLTNEMGNIRMASADSKDQPTGMPDVDATIVSWRNRLVIPGIA